MLGAPAWLSCSGGDGPGADAGIALDGNLQSDRPDSAADVLDQRDGPAARALAECIAPCLWDLIGECRPTPEEECVQEMSGSTLRVCYPSGKKQIATNVGTAMQTRAVYRPDGTKCYEVTTQNGKVQYRDASGRVVVEVDPLVDGGFGMSAVCGGRTYYMNTSSPMCAPWFGTATCRTGACAPP